MLSYSGLTNHGKVNLPSVQGWGTNMNILRDPPKSITTRRIDKVGDTIMLDQQVQESGDRAAECIRVYPRGSNVMVGVSYDNYGRNGGIGAGQQSLYKGQQSKMPYRVNNEGAYRPPILTQKDLLPLSRLPRVSFSVDPKATSADYSKEVIGRGDAKDYRSVKNQTLDVSMTVNKTQKVETPVEIGTAQYIQNVPKGASSTNVRYFYFGQDANKYTDNSIQQDKIQPKAFTNPSAPFEKKATESKLAYVNYIQQTAVMAFNSNIQKVSRTIPHTSQEIQLRNLLKGTQWSNIKNPGTKYVQSEYQSTPMKDVLKGEISTNERRPCNQQLKYESISYQPKNVLQAPFQTAIKGMRKDAFMSSEKKLNPTIHQQVGSFEAKPTKFRVQNGSLPSLKPNKLLDSARQMKLRV